jgi:hypothetical protein
MPDLPIGWQLYAIAVFTAALAVITLTVVFVVPELVQAARECWAEWFPPEPVPPHEEDALRRAQLDTVTRLSDHRSRQVH